MTRICRVEAADPTAQRTSARRGCWSRRAYRVQRGKEPPNLVPPTFVWLRWRAERQMVSVVVADAELVCAVVEIVHRINHLGAVLHSRPQRIVSGVLTPHFDATRLVA
jgi:hypothetical protein